MRFSKHISYVLAATFLGSVAVGAAPVSTHAGGHEKDFIPDTITNEKSPGTEASSGATAIKRSNDQAGDTIKPTGKVNGGDGDNHSSTTAGKYFPLCSGPENVTKTCGNCRCDDLTGQLIGCMDITWLYFGKALGKPSTGQVCRREGKCKCVNISDLDKECEKLHAKDSRALAGCKAIKGIFDELNGKNPTGGESQAKAADGSASSKPGHGDSKKPSGSAGPAIGSDLDDQAKMIGSGPGVPTGTFE